jgi:hypothetical protein
VLELEEAIIVVGEYYYNNNTKGIDKRSNKIKRGETILVHGSSKSSIEWKVGREPKEYIVQTSSTSMHL